MKKQLTMDQKREYLLWAYTSGQFPWLTREGLEYGLEKLKTEEKAGPHVRPAVGCPHWVDRDSMDPEARERLHREFMEGA